MANTILSFIIKFSECVYVLWKWRICLPNLVAQENGHEFLLLQELVQHETLQCFTEVNYYVIPWFAPEALIVSFLPGTIHLTSGRDVVLPLSPETSELLSWEPPRVRKLGRARTCCAVRFVLLHGFLGSPRAVRKFQLVRIFQARNHVPSEFSHSQGCISPEQRFQELLLNG